MTAAEIVPYQSQYGELLAEVERLRAEVAQREAAQTEVPDHRYDSEYIDGDPTPDDLEMHEDRTLEYTNGDKYQGDTLGDLRHGKGTHTCSNGDIYKGYWRLDKRHGRGKVTLANGMQYEGDWVDDKAHGHGKAKYTNGGRYEGDFKNEHRWGWGRHIFPGGDHYEGQWVDDKIQGQGRHTFLDGSSYEGSWVAGERREGAFLSGDGTLEYRGQWRAQLRHGQGTLFRRGLFKYTGEWREDVQEGLGTCVWADGSEFRGAWKAGVRHGRGVLSRPDGYTYDGEWADNNPHGTGTCRFEDGSRYEGGWSEGKREGQGKCKYANGDVYDGAWAGDVRAGMGTCAYANGDRYTGQWADDKRHGQGTCKFADGSKFSGQWDNDAWLQSMADPALSRLGGPGLTRATAGCDATFLIKAKDELKNRRLCGGDTFVVRLEGPSAVDGSVEDHGDGTYTATYQGAVAGTHTLSVTNDMDEHVADSPYQVTLLPGPPSAKHTLVHGPGRRAAAVGTEARFEVEARDAHGNRCEGADLLQALPIEVELQAGSISCPVSIEPGDEGCYSCTYTAREAGSYRLLVTCKGKPIGGSPFSVMVTGSDPAQHNATGAGAGTTIRDEATVWESIAAAQYKLDGDDAGWDSEGSDEETPEDKYIKAHSDVPVVENMEDLWKVGKLQRERQRKQELAAAKEARKAVVNAHVTGTSMQRNAASDHTNGSSVQKAAAATPAPVPPRNSNL